MFVDKIINFLIIIAYQVLNFIRLEVLLGEIFNLYIVRLFVTKI